jgi:predicted enzyme related to lactoylglutathione lyase
MLLVGMSRNDARDGEVGREGPDVKSFPQRRYMYLARFRHNLALYRKTSSWPRLYAAFVKRRRGKTAEKVANNVEHFTINANDVARARKFYSQVFGWTFEPWGPPDYFLIATGNKENPGIAGALHKRREIVPGKRSHGFECSISVADIDATVLAIKAGGGKILVPKSRVPGVGTFVMFEDTEANIVTAIEYEKPA